VTDPVSRGAALSAAKTTQCRTEGRLANAMLLRHELSSSPAQTLGSRVGVPFEARMSVCFHSVFVWCCISVESLRRADPPCKDPITVYRFKKLKKWPGPDKGLDNNNNNYYYYDYLERKRNHIGNTRCFVSVFVCTLYCCVRHACITGLLYVKAVQLKVHRLERRLAAF
jgi:hypothetical protein